MTIAFHFSLYMGLINSPIEFMIKGGNEPLDSFSFGAVKPIQSQKAKPIKNDTKTLLQQSVTVITLNDDSIEKRIPQDDNLFPSE